MSFIDYDSSMDNNTIREEVMLARDSHKVQPLMRTYINNRLLLIRTAPLQVVLRPCSNLNTISSSKRQLPSRVKQWTNCRRTNHCYVSLQTGSLAQTVFKRTSAFPSLFLSNLMESYQVGSQCPRQTSRTSLLSAVVSAAPTSTLSSNSSTMERAGFAISAVWTTRLRVTTTARWIRTKCRDWTSIRGLSCIVARSTSLLRANT